MIVNFDWDTFNKILINTTTSITYYLVNITDETRVYTFYTILDNGNIISTTYTCASIEEALIFEESFVKKPKVYPALSITKDEVKIIRG